MKRIDFVAIPSSIQSRQVNIVQAFMTQEVDCSKVNSLFAPRGMSEWSVIGSIWLIARKLTTKVCLLFYSSFIMQDKYGYREIFENIVLNYYLSRNGHFQSEYFSSHPTTHFSLLLSDTSMVFINDIFFICYELHYIWFTPSMQRIEYLFQEMLCGYFHIDSISSKYDTIIFRWWNVT